MAGFSFSSKGMAAAASANGNFRPSAPFVGTCANRNVTVRRPAGESFFILKNGQDLVTVARCRCGLLVFRDGE